MTELLTRADAPPVIRPRRDRRWLVLPVLVAAAALLVGASNLAGAPDIQDDEGTYVAQALAVLNGEFAPYTYWYDHPPFGWALLAPLLALAQMLGLDADGIVIAGRYASLPFFVGSSVLVFVIVRRIGGGPIASTTAAGLYLLSPLSLGYARMVFLDNIASFWVLLAFALVLSPRRSLFSHAAGGAAFGVAILSKLTALTAGPALLVALIDRRRWRTRGFSVATFLSIGMVVAIFFPLLALLRGELFSGAGHSSLQDGLAFQFLNRGGSGSILDDGSSRSALVSGWVAVDPVLTIAGVVAAIVCATTRRTRWVTVAIVCWALPLVVGSGYLPAMYVIAVLPLLAIAVGGSFAALGRWMARARLRGPRRWREAAGAIVIATIAWSVWPALFAGLFTDDRNADLRSVRAWVVENVPQDDLLVVPYSLWPDLHEAGWTDPWQLVAAEKVDLDQQFEREHAAGWRAIDWVVVGSTVRANIGHLGLDELDEALSGPRSTEFRAGEWTVYRLGNASTSENTTTGED